MPEVGLELHSLPRKHWTRAENMRKPGQSGDSTKQSEAKSVDIVHTSFLPDSGSFLPSAEFRSPGPSQCQHRLFSWEETYTQYEDGRLLRPVARDQEPSVTDMLANLKRERPVARKAGFRIFAVQLRSW